MTSGVEGHVLALEARLRAEDAAGAALTGEAMAHRDTQRLGAGGDAQLAAAACGRALYPETFGSVMPNLPRSWPARALASARDGSWRMRTWYTILSPAIAGPISAG